MTPKNSPDPDEIDSLGVLDDTASSDSSGIGLQGGTAQVSVSLPSGGEDDDLVDDEVVGGEVVSELVIDTSGLADEETLARISADSTEIVIELPEEDVDTASDAPSDADPIADVSSTEAAESVPDASDGVSDAAATESDAVGSATDATDSGPDAVDGASDAGGGASDAVDSATDSADPAPEEGASSSPSIDASALSNLESAVAAAKAELRQAMSPAASSSDGPAATQPRGSAGARSTVSRNGIEQSSDSTPPASATEAEALPTPPARPTVPAPAAKRLDDLGDAARESADLLTADRLLDPARRQRPEPEGPWSSLLYSLSGGRINAGDSRRARERKELSARIAAPLTGSARFVPVLSRKGGVGKTTITALLGMALADARDDRVIAVDANPDRGTLAERVVGVHTRSVRDLVRAQHDIRGFHDISALVARDETRLDVLASDSDPRVSEAFGDAGYRDVAAVAAQYYSLVLTDSGTGIVHSVMAATLDLADRLVIVSGLSVDEARLASETITWLETNGYAALARDAIVVLNQSSPGAPMVRLSELETHFATRVRQVRRIPYDAQIAGGGAIDFASLQPETRRAARELAATLIEGLRSGASS